jgi:hypothetical protein
MPTIGPWFRLASEWKKNTYCKGMTMFRLSSLLLAIALLSASFVFDAQAQARCDCAVKVASCQATITFEKQSFTMTSNTSQCSRLDWVLDAEPKIAVMTEGKASEPRPTQKAHPDFWLKSCYVCADTKFPGGKQASTADDLPTENTLLGEWCSQDQKGKASHTITRDGVVTKLDFGRSGRKFDKFSCNSAVTECKGEITGIKNLLGGDRAAVNLHYVFSFQSSNSGTLVINRINAADEKTLGTTKTPLTRCK